MRAAIDVATARRLALEASGLLGGLGRGTEGCQAAVDRLGAVQIDTISVVERAHHHILWSRVPAYGKGCIDRLEAEPRRIFEYWSHAAAYLPLDEYRFCLPRMERVRREGHDWFRADPKAVAYVRDRIAAEGPLRAQDFEEPMKGPRGWWDWKPAKVALEYLFHSGELTSVGRSGFQKVYDLAERALPADLDRRFPSEEEQAARHVDRAVASLGLFSARDIAYLRKEGKAGIPAEIAARIESGGLVEVEVGAGAKAKPAPCLASPAGLERASSAPRPKPRARILSPFDPCLIDRRRAARLFGYEYQLECYLPEAKRRFGYFGLPVLYMDGSGGSGFIALLDARADRAAGVLEARRLDLLPPEAAPWAGSGSRPRRPSPSALAAAIAAELRRFAAFNGAERVTLGRVEAEDPRFAKALKSGLAAR